MVPRDTASPAQALVWIGPGDPLDVAILDMQMPVMDGLAAARRIDRDWTAAERPRLIAMTANAMQGDRETCLAAGMGDCVNVRVFGATRLAELCKELDELAKADRLADAAGLLGSIDAERARVERALQELT
jgi:CheY-like chemotaxis protein